MSENILAKPVRTKYHEPAIETNFEEFRKVVESRRSVRVYETVDIPVEDVQKALDMALLAPNSSNLQTWEFYWVQTPEKKTELARACLSQNAAKTAPVLLVCVARPRNWKPHSKQMLEVLEQTNNNPPILKTYYSKVTPFAYGLGPFSIFGPLKWFAVSIARWFRILPMVPSSYSQLREWSVKSAALACENLMLAFRALGYDTCPMEGFDEKRVKKILDPGSNAHVVMVISAGKRAYHGVYGPRIRFPKEQFIKIL